MPVNHMKEYLIFVHTGVVFLQLLAELQMAPITPILRIGVYKWNLEDYIMYIFYENQGWFLIFRNRTCIINYVPAKTFHDFLCCWYSLTRKTAMPGFCQCHKLTKEPFALMLEKNTSSVMRLMVYMQTAVVFFPWKIKTKCNLKAEIVSSWLTHSFYLLSEMGGFFFFWTIWWNQILPLIGIKRGR